MEAAFLIRRLPSYAANVRKRLVHAPRIFWRDSGLLHALMSVGSLEQLYRQPWVGQSWEGFVIEQTLGILAAASTKVQPYYYRTSDGYELDLVLDWGLERWAVEVKLTSDPGPDMVDRLQKTADMIGATRRVLICRIGRSIENDRTLIVSLPEWLDRLMHAPLPG